MEQHHPAPSNLTLAAALSRVLRSPWDTPLVLSRCRPRPEMPRSPKRGFCFTVHILPCHGSSEPIARSQLSQICYYPHFLQGTATPSAASGRGRSKIGSSLRTLQVHPQSPPQFLCSHAACSASSLPPRRSPMFKRPSPPRDRSRSWSRCLSYRATPCTSPALHRA